VFMADSGLGVVKSYNEGEKTKKAR